MVNCYIVLSMKSFSRMFLNFLLNSCSVLLNLSEVMQRIPNLYTPVVEGCPVADFKKGI